MWRSVLLGAVLAGVLAGCSLGGGSRGAASTNKYMLANGAVRGSFNLHDPGVLPPTVTASQVWCDWAADKRHIVLHIRFRNAGVKRAKLIWYALGLVVDGVDSSAIFKAKEITNVPAGGAVVVDASVNRPRGVEPGAILTSCQPTSHRA
jgi:hypothetical protein